MSVPAARTRRAKSALPFLFLIQADLDRVEERISSELDSKVQMACEVSSHILEAGGKRLRPALVILSAKACAGSHDPARLTDIAAAAELIHMATLLHDDVIDGAESRRGRVTANSVWGNEASVLMGDYMLAKAFALLSQSGNARVLQAVAQAAITMSEGEISQIEMRGGAQLPVDSYLSVIHDKTAAFMSACCRIGAMLASAGPEAEDALAAYGRHLGLAFQITDDLLDLVGDPELTGKPIGGDIREGKATLPIILAMRKASPADRSSAERIISSLSATTEDIAFVRRLVEETGVLEDTRRAASNEVSDALAQLRLLPPSDYRDSLQSLAGSILTRER